MSMTKLLWLTAIFCFPAAISAQEAAAPAAEEPAAPGAEAPAAVEPSAAPAPAGDPWAGKLLGDWGGARQDLADKGITLDFGLTQIIQGNAYGGRDTNNGIRYSASSDIEMRLDFGKMDLIPGGSLYLHAEHKSGNGIWNKVGSLVPVNFDTIIPGEEECMFTLSEWIYTQVLFEGKLVLIGGKLFGGNAFDGNMFANDERTQFMNTAFRNNIVIPPFLPYTNLGFGVFVNPTEWLSIMSAVADSEGQAKTTGFETTFHGPSNTSLIHEWSFTVEPFDKLGHQRIGFVYSNMDTKHVSPVSPFRETAPMLMAMAPWLLDAMEPLLPFEEETENVAMYYSFDQYLFTEQDDPTQGLGVFGRFGWARESINPVHLLYSIGLSGKGSIPSRDNDTWGVAYYYADLADKLPPGFDSEQGIECYYSIEITPWLHISPDVQVIVDPGGRSMDETSLVYGMRVQMDF